MDAPSKPLAADLSPAESKRWMGRLLIAVVLGVAIWSFVAALTTAVVLPGLARVMETDPQSPLSLGKGDFNFPALFASALELCLAVIVALVLNTWAQRRPRLARRRAPSAAPAVSLSISAPPVVPVREPVTQVSPPAPPPAMPAPQPSTPVTQAVPQISTLQTLPPQPVKSEKPAKPKPPKEVYYNLVGEPVDPDE